MDTRKYKEKETGRRIVEVGDLSFLCDRDGGHSWLKIHFMHHRLRLMLRNADEVIAGNKDTADRLVRYYFVSRDKIVVR